MTYITEGTPLPVLIEATRQAWRHVRDVHGIVRDGSASWACIHHERAHRREGTPLHDAYTFEHEPDHHNHPPTPTQGSPS